MLREYFYPNVCGFCGKLIDSGFICVNCMKEIPYEGFSYIPFNQSFCFDELYCNYSYEGIIRSKILDYKFKHKKYLSKTFAEGMIYRFKKIKPNFDLIVPVPVHRTRKMERGYNQSELIAKILAKEVGIECNAKVLKKIKRNLKQSKLNKEQRISNVKNIFEIRRSNEIKGKTVLLIDDIYTTGATANECSRVLKKAGATKVIVYTVAKATVNSHID